MSLEKEKLANLIEIEGIDDDLALVLATFEGGECPAICMNADCSHAARFTPDETAGWCPACKTNSMRSGLVLAMSLRFRP